MHAFNFVDFDFASFNKIHFTFILNIFSDKSANLSAVPAHRRQTIYIQCINLNVSEINANMFILYRYDLDYYLAFIISNDRTNDAFSLSAAYLHTSKY